MRTAFEDSRHSGRMGLKEPAARKLVFKQQEELCLTGQRLNQCRFSGADRSCYSNFYVRHNTYLFS